jgi:hypothetical protein
MGIMEGKERRIKTPTLLGPLEGANLNHWRGDTYSVGSLRKN